MDWEEVKEKFDKMWVGLTAGGILPVLGFFLSKMVKDKQGSYTVEAYWNLLVGQTNYYLEILTFSLLPNMLAFYLFFFLWNMDRAVRGLIFMTIVYLGVIMMFH